MALNNMIFQITAAVKYKIKTFNEEYFKNHLERN